MKKRWWVLGAAGFVLAGGLLIAAKQTQKPKSNQETPFRLGKVQAEDLQVSVREVGMVDPFVKVDIKCTVSGRILSYKVREGDHVTQGEVLAEVEPDVNQAQTLSDVQGSVSSAKVAFLNADKDYKQQQELFNAGLVSEQAYRGAKVVRDMAQETLKSAQTRYQIVEDRGIPIAGNASTQHAKVISPMTGMIIKKGVELGDTIMSGVNSFNAGTVIYTVADLKSLIIKVNINEVDIAKVQVGQPVRITLDAVPQRTFTGKVRFVSPAAELIEKIKVFKVEVALDELDKAFLTGMSANVEILGAKRDKAISVPLEALQRRDGKSVVFRLKKTLTPDKLAAAKEGLSGRSKFVWLSDHWQDFFEVVPVTAGVATLERVEIISGLAKDDQVSLEDPTRKKVEKDEDNF